MRHTLAASLTAATLLVACNDHEPVKMKVNATNATFARRDSTRQLSPGDLRIATVDSAIELGLIGDSVVAGFGAATRAKIKRATDTAHVNSSGIGASIERMVKSSVAGALDHEMQVSLSEISDVRYEDGMMVFYGTDGKRKNFIENKDGNDHVKFSEADAQNFIAIFRAKKKAAH